MLIAFSLAPFPPFPVHVKSKMADDSDNEEQTIAKDLVVTKYKMAAEIINSKEMFEYCGKIMDMKLHVI